MAEISFRKRQYYRLRTHSRRLPGCFWCSLLLIAFLFQQLYFLIKIEAFVKDITAESDENLPFNGVLPKVSICPTLTPSMAKWRNQSMYQQKILRSVMKHKLFSHNCFDSQIIVASYDAISRDPLDSANFNRVFLSQLPNLIEVGKFSSVFLFFNLFDGTWPEYDGSFDYKTLPQQSFIAKASLKRSDFNPEKTLSLPLFLPSHRFRGHYLPSADKTSKSKYFLTFKGKRYLNGVGVFPRKHLYQIHDLKSGIIMLTTCKHGKGWEKLADNDPRCLKDNEEYEQYDYLDLISNSSFCLVARGRRRATYRFVEALQYGCIPVVIGVDDWVLPFEEIIDWQKACVLINGSDSETIAKIPTMLKKISLADQIKMRIQGQFLYYSYFSSVDSIVKTVLEVVARNFLPEKFRKPQIVWNRWPGGLAVDWPNYSHRASDFPFYHSFKYLPEMALIIQVNHKRDCSAETDKFIEYLVEEFRKFQVIKDIIVRNPCGIFEKTSYRDVDASFLLAQTNPENYALMLLDARWLYDSGENPEKIFFQLYRRFQVEPWKVASYSGKTFRLSGAITRDPLSRDVHNCTGLVTVPDFGQRGVSIVHRYYFHMYMDLAARSIREQASQVGHCEMLLLASFIVQTTTSISSALKPRDKLGPAKVDGVLSCSCYKIILDQFGYFPLQTNTHELYF